jgi:hypothetical protein
MRTTELSNDFAVQDEATAQLSSQGGVPVPLEALGREIVARIEAGDKARSRADDMYKSAGLQLMEARGRVPDFSVFLRDHCDGLSRSRAYELIAIAEGKADEVRSKNRTRDRRRREKAARVREPRTQGVATKKPQPPKSKAQWALAEFKVAVDTYFAKMDDEAKRAAFAYVKGKVSVTTS